MHVVVDVFTTFLALELQPQADIGVESGLFANMLIVAFDARCYGLSHDLFFCSSYLDPSAGFAVPQKFQSTRASTLRTPAVP